MFKEVIAKLFCRPKKAQLRSDNDPSQTAPDMLNNPLKEELTQDTRGREDSILTNPIKREKKVPIPHKSRNEEPLKLGNTPLTSSIEPKIYSLAEHKIGADRIDPQAFYVIHKLRQAGYKAYLVGGGVRDLLLNQKPKDFDISTSAKPEEIRAIFRNAILIGRRFRLAHVRFGKKIIEVSTFRAGETEAAGLIVRDNIWGTEEEDVLRRDFTINGLFYDPETEEVIDYVDGYQDIEKRVLRTIGKPEVRFSQDPVRMIRLIKFCARFNFEIEKPTFEALIQCKKEILKSSSARVFEELLRMLESGSAKTFFHLLHQYGMLHSLLPELSHYLEIRPESSLFSLLDEIDAEVKKQTAPAFDRSLLLSALIFPLFDEFMKSRISSQTKLPHLGQIAESANHVIDCIFTPFFTIPRRMKSIVAFLMTTQYRFVPLDGRALKKARAPNDPFFPVALHLLKLRATVHTELLPHYTFWTATTFDAHSESAASEVSSIEEEPRRPRRRRRRPPA